MDHSGKQILIVDDSPEDVLLIKRGLTAAVPNAELKVAQDGEEAYRLLFGLAPGSRLPNLILLDIKLPRMTGPELLTEIRAEPTLDFVPVVMLTSSVDLMDMGKCYKLRANSFLQKSIDFDEFMEILGFCARYWLKANVQPSVTVGEQTGYYYNA
jgi:two-component system, response regulator